MFVQNFLSETPPHFLSQEEAFNWFADAALFSRRLRKEEGAESRDRYLRKLRAFGCGPDRIHQRGGWISDFTHTRFSEMTIFTADPSGRGTPLSRRSEFFSEWANRMAERLLDPKSPPPTQPRELIHITCTGYSSPSAVQRWTSRHRSSRETQTRISHAYHMGCYAALPAIRQAVGSLAAAPDLSCVDLLHTELCSLHFHPEDERPEQLVVHSLFADGAIRYQVSRNFSRPSFRILEIQEKLIPHS